MFIIRFIVCILQPITITVEASYTLREKEAILKISASKGIKIHLRKKSVPRDRSDCITPLLKYFTLQTPCHLLTSELLYIEGQGAS